MRAIAVAALTILLAPLATAQATGMLEGIVRMPDGSPASDAVVIVQFTTDIGIGRSWTANTTPDGAYRLTLPVGNFSFAALRVVEAPGAPTLPFARACPPACVHVRENETTPLDAQLPPAAVVTGVLTDEAGHALAGARVSITYLGQTYGNDTDALGRYRILAPPGELTIRARPDDLSPVRHCCVNAIAGEMRWANLTARPGVELRIVADMREISGRPLTLIVENDDDRQEISFSTEARARLVVAPGKYRVAISGEHPITSSAMWPLVCGEPRDLCLDALEDRDVLLRFENGRLIEVGRGPTPTAWPEVPAIPPPEPERETPGGAATLAVAGIAGALVVRAARRRAQP